MPTEEKILDGLIVTLYNFLVFHLMVHIVDRFDITDERRMIVIVLREISVLYFEVLLTHLIPPTGDGLNCSCLVEILFGVGSDIPIITVIIRVHTFFVDETEPIAVIL